MFLSLKRAGIARCYLNCKDCHKAFNQECEFEYFKNQLVSKYFCNKNSDHRQLQGGKQTI